MSVNLSHKLRPINFDFFKDFIYVFLYCKEISLNSFFLEKLDTVLLSRQIGSWNHDIHIMVDLCKKLLEQVVCHLISKLVLFRLRLLFIRH